MRRLLWTAIILLVIIGLAAVARRTYALTVPPPDATLGLDPHFVAQKSLTLLHILPAAILFLLLPFQFVPKIRARHPAFHRWSGRLILLIGGVTGLTALVMSFTMSIGGVLESSATTIYALLFLAFLALGFRSIRRRRIAEHREWMIRAFGVALGVAATRPVVGAFFAARRMTPEEFFGIAFWIGFTTTLIAAEAWVRYTRGRINATGPESASGFQPLRESS